MKGINLLKAFAAGGCRALFVVFTVATVLAIVLDFIVIYKILEGETKVTVFLFLLPVTFVLGGIAFVFGWIASELY